MNQRDVILAYRLWSAITEEHGKLGAPIEPFDPQEHVVEKWQFHVLGEHSLCAICPGPEDEDAFVIAIDPREKGIAGRRALRVMQRHCASGRMLHTLAFVRNFNAIRVNRQCNGEFLGLDADGFFHYRHTAETLSKRQRHPKALGYEASRTRH